MYEYYHVILVISCLAVIFFGRFFPDWRISFNNWYWLRSPFRSPQTLQNYFDKNSDILRWPCNQCGQFLDLGAMKEVIVKNGCWWDHHSEWIRCNYCGDCDVFTWRREEGSIGRSEPRQERRRESAMTGIEGNTICCVECMEEIPIPQDYDNLEMYNAVWYEGFSNWMSLVCPSCGTSLRFRRQSDGRIYTKLSSVSQKQEQKPLSPEEKLEVFLTKQAKRKVKL